ncbi:MAG: hypothetical protein EAZ85_10570 [Bacteroidetes bacterium]|nr:MAG: hypothetical protein EAZ85_10570 [Bacteroidota bacterium]TAG90126.1 MAG: hypothetical protein EAZ20_05040 [Bacteroidota bacterium]
MKSLFIHNNTYSLPSVFTQFENELRIAMVWFCGDRDVVMNAVGKQGNEVPISLNLRILNLKTITIW